MSSQDTKKRTDWLMRLAQMASITVGLIILTEFLPRHWETIVSTLRIF